MLKSARGAVIAFVIAASGGAVFALLGLPLPWTLGAMAAAATASLLGNRWPMPRPARSAALPVVGVLAGSAFTPEIAAQVPQWWPELLMVTAYSLAVSVLGFLLLRRLGGLDRVTAYFSSVPGGLGELSLLGERYGGSVRSIAFIHSIRIVAVVFTVPVLLLPESRMAPAPVDAATGRDLLWLSGAAVGGFLLARYARFPGGAMIAAMALSAVIHATGLSTAAPPPLLVILAQILIGAVTGSRFAGTTLAQMRLIGLLAVGWAVVLLSSAAAAAYAATLVSPMPFSSLLLAIAPGGTPEMIIIAVSLQIDVAFVALCQVWRVMLALTCAPLIFALLGRYRPPDG